MALPSNKASASTIMSGRPNSSARNSETSNPIRRSFSGNPFTKPSVVTNPRGFNPNTPANSPSDFHRRNSIGRDQEDKENTKDHNLKPGRVRSPAVASKGTKNFMSPTISAASKITPSPKKKILVERNEPARTSLSFSTEKSPCRSVRFSDIVENIDSKADASLEENKTEASDDKEASLTASSISEALRCEEVLDPEVTVSSKIDSKSLPETVTDEPDCVNLDPTFKISPTSSCSWSCPILAPLDADPSLPPYDPKTNYLSPRPQFLHYRPNPRIEVYLNKDDGRQLEESFISGSFSDTDATEEAQSDYSQKESEDVSSVEILKEEEEEEEKEVNVSEPSPISTHLPKEEEEEEEEKEVDVSELSPISTHLPKEEETMKAKGGSKLHLFTRSKFMVLLLVLSVACLSVSVTNSPVIDPSVLKESSFIKIYDSYEIAEFAKVNLDGLAQNFRLWYANSISFVSELILSFKGVPISGPLHYCNLTVLHEDRAVDGYLVFDHSPKGTGEKFENINVLGSMRESEVDMESLEDENQHEIEADEDVGDVLEGLDDPEYEEVSQEIEEVSAEHGASESEEVLPALEAEVIQTEKSEEEVGFSVHLDSEQQSNLIYIEQPVMVPMADEIQPQVSEAGEIQGECEKTSFDEMESAKGDLNPESPEFHASAENLQSSEDGEFTLNGTKETIFIEKVMGITFLFLTVIAAAGFLYVRKSKNIRPNASINVEQPLLAKKLDFSPMSLERPSSRNWPTEVDMVGESCPSEMSSLQRSPSYSKKNEAQSQERRARKNYKRESLASSSDYSMASHSYGSFTTYEKIPTKHGHVADEETITPVRRSSRIRSQVTSP
ncbi:uncharacterized protein LOC115973662 isoform X2 [Quercus lobata]|uniref:Uncharacterized protein n=1 Tax=Quercus lobata TaxID=97700 RepID=A0A7N2N6R0_QUELO|nr:uncharacterized protein LOC115973662 isoform X2 [Quercus lobata]